MHAYEQALQYLAASTHAAKYSQQTGVARIRRISTEQAAHTIAPSSVNCSSMKLSQATPSAGGEAAVGECPPLHAVDSGGAPVLHVVLQDALAPSHQHRLRRPGQIMFPTIIIRFFFRRQSVMSPPFLVQSTVPVRAHTHLHAQAATCPP